MLARVAGAVLAGIEACHVEVQVDLTRMGLPGTQTVGLPGTVVRESQERVRIAIRNSGFKWEPSRITVNLAPADLPKQGSVLDLAVAVAIVLAESCAPGRPGWMVVGELALDGTVRSIAGALPMAIAAREAKLAGILLPEGNAREAASVGGLAVVGVPDLSTAADFLLGKIDLEATRAAPYSAEEPGADGEDLSDVRGQLRARRALEIAAAGSHNVLFIGPPGTGKTMLARRLRTILPPLTVSEAIEVTRIASAAGLVRAGDGLARVRPFRAPHHSITSAGLIGGGATLRPGEVSLASEGVLFLDELPEFERRILDQLRQPIEDGQLTLVRCRQRFTFPSRFLLVAGMNPCPCGYRGHASRRCVCTPPQIARYVARISGPLWDRFDLIAEVPPVPIQDLEGGPAGESSALVRNRVEAARRFQAGRALRAARDESRGGSAGRPARGLRLVPHVLPNARLAARDLPAISSLPSDAGAFLKDAASRLTLSARAIHRVLRVARTIADLGAEDKISMPHLAEALQYRARNEAP